MGLFSALTRPAWEKAQGRAEKAERAGDLAGAWRELGVALESCPEAERAEIEGRRNDLAARLYETHAKTAGEAERAGDLEHAGERWELALTFATDEAAHEQAEAALRRLAAIDVRDAQAAHEAFEAERDEASDEEVFTMLLGHLDEDLADRYEALGPEFRHAFVALGKGLPEEAVDPLAALAKDSDSGIVHYELGTALLALGRFEEALAAVQRAEALDSAWNAVRLALAHAAWALERWEDAEGALQRAVDLDPDDPHVLAAVARHSLLTREPAAGLDATEVGLELEPLDRDLMLLRGQLLEMADRPTEALDCFETLVKRYWTYDGENDRLNFDRESGLLAARLYLRRGMRLERAEELLRAAMHVTAPADRWPIELELGELLKRLERGEEAQEVLREASLRIPESEAVGRLCAAHLLGDGEAEARLLQDLDEDGRRRWESWLARHEPPTG